MMWVLLFLLCMAQPEQATSQDDDRLILQGGENPCEGYIEVLHKGIWGVVGDTGWSLENEDVVCKSINCGSSQNASVEVLRRDGLDKVWLNEVNCSGSERNLWNCAGYPGWGVSYYGKDTVKKIKCKDAVELRLDGFRCAGAVQFNKSGTTSFICHDNWDTDQAELLCQILKCGNLRQIPDPSWMTPKQFYNSAKKKIKCSGTKHETHPWQCAPKDFACQNPASVICSDHQRLQLSGNRNNVCSGQLEMEEDKDWKSVSSQNSKTKPELMCKQMNCGATLNITVNTTDKAQLTCSDNVSVILMDAQKDSGCYGTVYTSVNNVTRPVCASNWDPKNAEVVCRELNCGKVSHSSAERTTRQQGFIDNVRCSGREASLWHCMGKHDNDSFPCSSLANVICADSLTVKLSDGPGKCAGRLEIQHRGEWKAVRKSEYRAPANSDKICNFIKCGKARQSTSADKFTNDSSSFMDMTLNCKSDSNSIADCITSGSNIQKEPAEPVEIICQEHKVIFLNGSSSCSGMVGIEHGDKNFWLSGSRDTWNLAAANAVCRQMHCGEKKKFSSISRAPMMNDVWRESFNCSSDSKSLFDCDKHNRTQADHNATIATVTCTGKVTMKLKNQCWGLVQVCVDGKCGGVCADTWSDSKSKMLCKNLGCGNKALPTDPLLKSPSDVLIKSLHTTKQTTSLADSNMVINRNGPYCSQNPAYVVCSGSVVPKFQISRDKCSGNLEVFYQGEWRPVCLSALTDKNAQNTICSELQCGQAAKELNYFGPRPSRQTFISQLKCSASGGSLATCDIGSSTSCTPGGLQCSDWRKMALKMSRKACAGDVFVHSEGNKSAVYSEGWTEVEGKMLCQDLNCGNYISKEEKEISVTPLRGKSFKCASVENPQSIWECEREATGPTSLNKQLQINCEDEPSITLSATCSGQVQIDGSGVCSANWQHIHSEMVCQEKMCGNAIHLSASSGRNAADEHVHHVSCESYNYKLGQCKRWHTKAKCEGQLVSVYCTKNVKFNTTEKCGGQILVNYRDKWEAVCPLTSFTANFKDSLCNYLQCGELLDYEGGTNGESVNLIDTTLQCGDNIKDIKYCVLQKGCKEKKPAEIYCQGYVIPPTLPEASNNHILAISLGGLCLIIVIVICGFGRVCIVKKDKKFTLRPSIRREVEVENPDYDDIMSCASEMKEFSHREISLESSVIKEKDARSTSSLYYDDIDKNEETLAQPLTSGTHTPTASDSEDSYVNDFAQNVVTYEVDNPKCYYDDKAAAPEILQTEAEVHDSHQTKSDSNTEDSVGGEHYPVPDQDGRRAKRD